MNSSPKRAETLLLLARQLAQFNGLVWARCGAKVTSRYLALAGMLLTTVERKAEVSWKEAPSERET
jgi:hypothetical protein